jgi:hypothetical protein
MLGELPTWKLEDLYSSPTGPDLDADLKRAAADAEAGEDVVVVTPDLGLPEQFPVLDLLTGARYRWRIGRNYVGLGPGQSHLMKIGA